jgi:hypothetical protein
MFRRDNIPGIEGPWFVQLFLFPGMVIQWTVYMTPSGNYARVRSSTRVARSPIMTWVYSIITWFGFAIYLITRIVGK